MPQRAKVSRVWRFRKGMSSGRPRHSGWPALIGRPPANRPGTSRGRHRPEGDAPARRLDLDHRLQPEQAARAGAHDLDRRGLAASPPRAMATATLSAPTARAAASRGTKKRVVIAPPPGRSRRCDSGVQPRHRLAVEHRRGRGGTEAQTIGRLDVTLPSGVVPPQSRSKRSSTRRAKASPSIDWQASARQSFST